MVATKIVEGKHIIIATGGRAKQLPNLPVDGKKVHFLSSKQWYCLINQKV
jgi:pyruvate/2-oxoglutarate dehydrogenase complex dihydrolipoamide dehydrogenase (E3) component